MAGLWTNLLALALLMAAPAADETISLAPAMEPLRFLVGHWEGAGDVTDAHGRSHGVSTIGVEADGRVLLRRDHTEVVDVAGKRTEGFGQLMVVYGEGPGVRADYMDGEGHVIHYGPAVVVAGRSVEFTSAEVPGAPTFRLRYDAVGAERLKVAFTIRPPGQATFQPIAVGELHRTAP